MPAISPARRIAFDILAQVEAGAHSTDLLHRQTASLSPRDAALAHELTLGPLRRRAQLDFLIEHFSAKPPSKLDPEVRLALHLGIYQLRYLDRIPAHAAISESVELVHRARIRSATGFVNAVLRKVHREPIPWPTRAVEFCIPEWMLNRWQDAEVIAQAFLKPPETWIRVPPGTPVPEGAEPTGLPGCYLWTRNSPPEFRIQDIGSQSIVPLLELTSTHRMLDLCAAPGGKTAQARETTSQVIAADRSLQRLATIAAPRVTLDATQPLPFRAVFDRILVDAPCSGTGTIGRNPEIRWRVTPEDLVRHQERQIQILHNALTCLVPNGKLVYSTCSLEPEENESVVAQLPPGWQVEATLRRTPGQDPGDSFFAARISRKPR